MHYFDPRGSYRNFGERGCSSLQTTEMNLLQHEQIDFEDKMHYQLTMIVPHAVARQLLAEHPEYFDNCPQVSYAQMDDQARAEHDNLLKALADPESSTSKFAAWVDAKRAVA